MTTLIDKVREARKGATQGPWDYDLSRHTHDCVIFQRGASSERYGYVDPDDGGVVGSSEWIWIKEGDARLIALAPEMAEALEAAEELADCVELQQKYSPGGPLRDALARYRKATGETT